MRRSEIAIERTWRLEDIYETPEAFEADFAAAEKSCAALAAYKGTLGGGSKAVLAALTCRDEGGMLLEKLFAFAMMRKDEDTANNASQGLMDRMQGLGVRFGEASSYMTPELLALPEGAPEAMLREEPKLAPYARFFSELQRMRAHVLDEAGEKLLAMAGEVFAAPHNIFSMLNNADMKFAPIQDAQGNEMEVTHASYSLHLENPDRAVRKAAFESIYASYKKQLNTIAATYASSVKADVFSAKARRYESSLIEALEVDEVPRQVYDNLIATIRASAPEMARYLQLRKKRLGVDELYFYDLYVPIANEWDLRLPYEQALDVVRRGLAPLGEDYMRVIERALTSRWLDVYESEGKTSGAYSAGVYGVHPFILLNYQETLDNIFTIAHELGHTMHSYYSAQSQPYPTSDYVIFVAEVASTVNEMLLLHHLIETAPDAAAKAALLNHKLETIRATVYRQTLFAAFELESHRMAEAGEPLTGESMSAMYRKLYEDLYPGLTIDDNLPLEWARIPHFYRAFYVYKYATGLSAAIALSRGILEKREGALEKYLAFLSSGGSKSPLDLLRDAGVDMEKPEPVQACMREFADTLRELEALLA